MKPYSLNELKNAKDHVNIFNYLDYREFLDAIYHWGQDAIGKFSYRQYSQFLGFSLTNIIGLIIQGRRPLTSKAACRVISALNLTGKKRQYFEKLVAYYNARNAFMKEEVFKALLEIKTESLSSEKTKERLAFYSEWYHSAIFEMLALPNINYDHIWIAHRLRPRIRPEQVRESFELLESLGLIRFDHNLKKYLRIDHRVTTGDEINSIALIRYHQKFIEIALNAVTSTPSKERDISSITISIPKNLLPDLKSQISAFRKKLLSVSEQSKNVDHVYQLNIQLFPLLNMETKDE